jgi:hypothetical protein
VRQVIVPVPTEDDFASADEADASRDGDESRQTDVG